MLNSTPSSSNVIGAVFPNHLIHPKEKDSNWIKDYAKAMWYQYLRYNSNIGYINRSQYEINRLYSMGMQDINQYKDQIDIKDAKDDGSYLNLDWSPLAIGSKYHNLIKGMMSRNGYKISANAVNPTAIDKKTNSKLKDTFNLTFKTQIEELNAILGMQYGQEQQQPGKPDFTSLEEIELYYEQDYKLDEEMAVVDAWNIISETNDWNRVIKEQLSEDLIDYGICGTRDYVDSNGVIKIRRINPENLIVGWSDRPDFKDCPHFGEVIFYTIAELKQLSSSSAQQFNEEQWEKLAKSCLGNYNNPISFLTTYNYSLARPYDGIRVPVMDFEFESVNRYEYVKEVNPDGNATIVEHDPKLGTLEEDSVFNRKMIRKDFKVLYTGQWVCGTDLIFNAGLAQNLKRRNGSLQDVMSNYHLYAPTKKGMRVKSLMEYMIPVINLIHINWYKLQGALAKARPKGLAIDIAGISGITKGTGGETYTPMEVLEIFDATGNQLYRSTDDNGRPLANGRLPLQELENGMANDVFKFIEIINYNHKLIYDIIGFNEVSAGSTPNPETGKAQSEMALSATNNALQPLFVAYSSVLERTARSCIQRLQDTSKHGVKGYEAALGSVNLAVLGSFPDLSLWDFGIIVSSMPNDQEIAILEQMIMAELTVRSQGGAGGITFSDYLTIKDIMKYNIKKAARVLDQRKKRQAAEDAKIQQSNSQANSEMQAQASQQAMTMAFEFEKQKMMMSEQLKAEREKMLEEIKLQGKAMLQEMANEALLSRTEMQVTGNIIVADGKNHIEDTKNMRDNQYRIEHADMNNEHDALKIMHMQEYKNGLSETKENSVNKEKEK